MCIRRNGTVWELATEFTGSWKISTTNSTLSNANITLFPALNIPNLSLALIDPTNDELVKFFGDFEANIQTKKLEFRFDEMALLGIRSKLPESKRFSLDNNNRPPSPLRKRVGKTSKEDTTKANKTKPFQETVATNETSESMNEVLSWFDVWYDAAISDGM